MDTDSLNLSPLEENLEDFILPEKRNEWEAMRLKNCTDRFTANATGNFFPRTCCNAHKKNDKIEPGLFEEDCRCSEMLSLCRKTYCCYDRKSNMFKFSHKVLIKKNPGRLCGHGLMSNYRKVLEEAVEITSKNRGFRTMKHSVATYEKKKKGLSYFYPKCLAEEDEVHTKPQSFCIAFSHISIRTHNKLSAGVRIIRERQRTEARAGCKKQNQFKKIFRNSLTVPKLSHSIS